MSRATRKQRLQLKPYLDKLETRRMMSLGGAGARFARIAAHEQQALETQLADGDLNAFASTLAHRPGLAADMGLGALSQSLRQHAGYAQRYGWGAALVSELDAHTRYAAAHHLAGLTVPQTPPTNPATPPTQTTITTTQSGSQSGGVTSTPPVTTSPVLPSPVLNDPLSVAVGGTLDVTLPSLGLGTTGVTFTITPQPLPANISFNRGTGVLEFSPAPGQEGIFDFSVAISNGSQKGTIVLPITVTDPALATTEVSGQVVDENGEPLANMPVSIDGSSAVTNASGDFTLTAISSNPGPISAGGSVGSAQGRQDLTAPVAQLLGHAVYSGANNVIPSPLILPMINWSTAASFSQPATSQAMTMSNAALPGFAIQVPASSAAGAFSVYGTLSVAQLSAAVSAQHMPEGLSGGMVLFQFAGSALTQPVELTLPNTQGYKPGSVLNLYMLNPTTGGHDAVGEMVVSADGQTMTSMGAINLGGSQETSAAGGPSPDVTPDQVTQGCLLDSPDPDPGTQDTSCAGCQPTITGSFPPTPTGTAIVASDAGLVTGEYFLDHQLVTYQSQGQNIGIDLQYSSAQADPTPVVQYQFTTPAEAGDSSSITSINAQVSLAGVSQGTETTYNTPDGLTDGETYNIPLQVDASELATGVYPYTMTVTENFGSGDDETSITMTGEGNVNVVNESSDPLGAGWSVGGLQQLSQVSSGGPVLITAGQQGTEQFDPVYSDGPDYYQDLGLASSTSTAQVLTNNGTGSFTTSGTPSSTGVIGSVAGDFNGDGEPDMAVVSTSTLAILLNNGSGGFTAGSSYTLPSGESALAIAAGNFTGHDDGTLDLAVLLGPAGKGGYYEVALYTGNGDGTFATPVITSLYGGMANVYGSLTVGDFSGDGKADLFAIFGPGDADILMAGSGGAFTVSSFSLPAGQAGPLAAATVDYNSDGNADLVVEINGPAYDLDGEFASVDLFQGNGSGGFTYESTEQLVGHTDGPISGIVAGDFQGPGGGLEVAVPMVGYLNGYGVVPEYVDVVPVSSSGTWGPGVLYSVNNTVSGSGAGDIVSADLNGAGKPSIALTDGTGDVYVLLADPASNQLLPIETISLGSSDENSWLAAAPFAGNAAVSGYRGPTSDPSTLVQNEDGSWTRTYPDGTVIEFNSSGQETSESDANDNTFHYAYVSSGAAAGALATITDPVGLTTTLAYSSGQISTITDPALRVTSFTLDAHDNLTSITDPDGATTSYGYSTPTNHEATTETDPNGNTATAHYNSFGELTSETLFDGTSSTSVSSMQSQGLLAPGGSGSLQTTMQATATDPDGRTTTLTFNWMSHPTNQVEPTGATTTTTYNNQGFPATETDAMGRTVSYTYSSFAATKLFFERELRLAA